MKAKQRWYRYYYPGNGGRDYQFVYGTLSWAKETADAYLRSYIASSGWWRGMRVEAKRPPMSWLTQHIKNTQAGIKNSREYLAFLKSETS